MSDFTVLLLLGSDQQIYEKSITIASHFMSSSQIQLLKLALSLHIYAPTVEMYSQMAKEHGIVDKGCPCAVFLKDKILCHPSDLEKHIAELVRFLSLFNKSATIGFVWEEVE